MAGDLDGTPDSGIEVQLCGDAHVSNFGGFAAPDRELVFDMNDFDETARGPWEWDIKRLVASIAVAGRDLGCSDARSAGRRRGGRGSIATRCAGSPTMRNLDVWYARTRRRARSWSMPATGSARRSAGVQAAGGRRAARRTPARAVKLTERSTDSSRIVSRPPLIVPIEELSPTRPAGVEEQVRQPAPRLPPEPSARAPAPARGLPVRAHGAPRRRRRERRHALLDRAAARPRRRRPALPPGQAGAARRSLEPYHRPQPLTPPRQAGGAGPAADAGRRRHLPGLAARRGPTEPRDYYVRQLWDWKLGADVELMPPAGCASTGRSAAGRSLARMPAPATASRSPPTSARATSFDRALAAFAEAYADQNERDHAALDAAAAPAASRSSTAYDRRAAAVITRDGSGGSPRWSRSTGSPRYDRRWLRGDIAAGVAVDRADRAEEPRLRGIAGIPMQNGLYAAAAGRDHLRAVLHVAADLDRAELLAGGRRGRRGARDRRRRASGGAARRGDHAGRPASCSCSWRCSGWAGSRSSSRRRSSRGSSRAPRSTW